MNIHIKWVEKRQILLMNVRNINKYSSKTAELHTAVFSGNSFFYCLFLLLWLILFMRLFSVKCLNSFDIFGEWTWCFFFFILWPCIYCFSIALTDSHLMLVVSSFPPCFVFQNDRHRKRNAYSMQFHWNCMQRV